MIECKVCGCKFNPVRQGHYIVRDNEKASALAPVLSSNAESMLYDAFNCIQCGCQIVAQQRKMAYITGFGEKQVSLGSNLEDDDEDDKDGVKLQWTTN